MIFDEGYNIQGDHMRSPRGPWKKHFAWFPVVIDGERYFFKTIYKRSVGYRGGNVTEYGTILDVLKTPQPSAADIAKAEEDESLRIYGKAGW